MNAMTANSPAEERAATQMEGSTDFHGEGDQSSQEQQQANHAGDASEPPTAIGDTEDPLSVLAEKAEELVDVIVDTIDELISLLDTESEQLHAMNTEALTRFHAHKHNLIGRYEEALGELRADHMPALTAALRDDLRLAMEDLRRAVETHDRALQAMTRANQALITHIADAVSRVGSASRPTTYDRAGRTTDTVKPKPVAGYLNDNF